MCFVLCTFTMSRDLSSKSNGTHRSFVRSFIRSFLQLLPWPAHPARASCRVVVNDHVKYLAGWRNNFTTRETPGWHINLWLLRDGRSNFQDRWTLADQTPQSLGRARTEHANISLFLRCRRVACNSRDHARLRVSHIFIVRFYFSGRPRTAAKLSAFTGHARVLPSRNRRRRGRRLCPFSLCMHRWTSVWKFSSNFMYWLIRKGGLHL